MLIQIQIRILLFLLMFRIRRIHTFLGIWIW